MMNDLMCQLNFDPIPIHWDGCVPSKWQVIANLVGVMKMRKERKCQ
jgi:hypothetical protein